MVGAFVRKKTSTCGDRMYNRNYCLKKRFPGLWKSKKATKPQHIFVSFSDVVSCMPMVLYYTLSIWCTIDMTLILQRCPTLSEVADFYWSILYSPGRPEIGEHDHLLTCCTVSISCQKNPKQSNRCPFFFLFSLNPRIWHIKASVQWVVVGSRFSISQIGEPSGETGRAMIFF